MEVVFTKARSDTILRAAFHSTLADGGRAYGGECSEWFITFNGKECTSPAPITTSRHKYGYGRYGHDGWLTVPGQVGGVLQRHSQRVSGGWEYKHRCECSAVL